MAPRIRPATTLVVVLSIAFAFQLIAILSVPVTKSISICTYDGYKFGVFGLCRGNSCSKVGIGYTGKELDDVDGFSLPSNARRSVSKLLVVHPISAGFSIILLFSSALLHWHGPSNSLRFLFFLLLWTIPSFLISLLSFLVDILLFVPHLDWGGWIVLAATVLIAVSGVLLCIMRRTVSSRRVLKRKDTFGNDYQLEPLNYGYGTVDGNSDVKFGKNSYEGKEGNENEEEREPFVHESNETFDNSMNYTRTHENLNDYPSTQLYDSMRGENNRSGQSNSTGYRSPENILAPLSTAYRGEFNFDRGNENPTQEYIPSAPYPSDIPNAGYDANELQQASEPWRAPYPNTNDDLSPHPEAYNANSVPYVGSKPSGPRPMPTPTTTGNEELPMLPSELAAVSFNNMDGDVLPEPYSNRDSAESLSAPPLPSNLESSAEAETGQSLPGYPFNERPDPLIQETKRLYESDPPNSFNKAEETGITREATYRTKIANAIDQLQGPETNDPAVYSNPSFINTNESLLASQSALNASQIPPEIKEDDNDDELYGPVAASSNANNEHKDRIVPQNSMDDDASSSYSSHIPSTVNSPVDATFARTHSLLTPNRGLPNKTQTTSSMAIDNIYDRYARDSTATLNNASAEGKEDGLSANDYPFPDPHEKRVTPAPSFSNISLVSSNFTSVSQRGINPKYFEKNPEEKLLYLQQQQQQQDDQLQSKHPLTVQTRPRPLQTAKNNTDILIASNPDFSVLPINKRNGKRKPGR